MRLLRPSLYRAALTSAALALGLITVIAVAGTSATAATSSHIRPAATAATSSFSHVTPAMAATSSFSRITPAIAAREGLIRSPLGWHTPLITARLCSSSTAHWFTLHINYLGGPTDWHYYCFGGKGTWYFVSNVIAWTCSGNNYGHFEWYPATGGEAGTNFGAAWSRNWPQYTDVDYITINGWSGSYNCP
jgi:hypothetical protein